MSKKENVAFLLLVITGIGVLVFLYLGRIFTYNENNPETMDAPRTVGYADIAREQGIPLKDFSASSPVFDAVKREDPKQSFDYPRHRFSFEWFSLATPTLNIAYIPFVRFNGVNADTIALYSNFYAILAIVVMAIFAFIAFNRWVAIFSVLFLVSSLSWLIHVKVGASQWMPSVFLITCLMVFVLLYAKKQSRWYLVGTGIALGMLYLTGWISCMFGGLLLGIGILMLVFRRKQLILLDLLVAGLTLLGTVAVISFLYAWYCGCRVWDIQLALFDGFFSRYSQGAVAGVSPTFMQKLTYGFKCMFIDMTQYDHLDKCLEGKPAISWLFSLFFAGGLFISIRRHELADKYVLLWIVAIFVPLGTIYLFAHRYALMGLSAMAILAGVGVDEVMRRISASKYPRLLWPAALILFAGYLATVIIVEADYYEKYLLHKKADFEIDRTRGHAAFANWLKKNCKPEETLVVLGDPIMLPHTCFMFNTFGCRYEFIYWSNYAGNFAQPAGVLAWETEAFKKYKKIVYAFSTRILGGPTPGTYLNDCRPFMAAHPQAKPVLAYSYDGRPVSLVVFEIGK